MRSLLAPRARVGLGGLVPAGSVELPLFMRMMSSVGPSVGADHGSAVSTRYAAPFSFTGVLHEVADLQRADHGRPNFSR